MKAKKDLLPKKTDLKKGDKVIYYFDNRVGPYFGTVTEIKKSKDGKTCIIDNKIQTDFFNKDVINWKLEKLEISDDALSAFVSIAESINNRWPTRDQLSYQRGF